MRPIRTEQSDRMTTVDQRFRPCDDFPAHVWVFTSHLRVNTPGQTCCLLMAVVADRHPPVSSRNTRRHHILRRPSFSLRRPREHRVGYFWLRRDNNLWGTRNVSRPGSISFDGVCTRCSHRYPPLRHSGTPLPGGGALPAHRNECQTQSHRVSEPRNQQEA